MRNIPFFNYPALYENKAQELQDVIMDVCARGAYILQDDLKNFETNLAKFLNVKPYQRRTHQEASRSVRRHPRLHQVSHRFSYSAR